jgi:hypothetical protein
MAESKTSAQVRDQMLEALVLDLIGPVDHPQYEDERLEQAPSQWYLTGFVVPRDRRVSRDLGLSDAQQQSIDFEEDEEEEEPDNATSTSAGSADDTDKEAPKSSSKPKILPSSMGLTVLVPRSCRSLEIVARWGDYFPVDEESVPENFDAEILDRDVPESPTEVDEDEADLLKGLSLPMEPSANDRKSIHWLRSQREERMTIDLDAAPGELSEKPIPGSNGLRLDWISRETPEQALDPSLAEDGARTVSVFLVNERQAVTGRLKDLSYAFQAELTVLCTEGFVPRSGMSGLRSSDEDLRIGDLQYRDVFEYAVGHNASACSVASGRECRLVKTAWIPTAAVELVEPARLDGVEMRMEELAELADHAAAERALRPLASEYEAWIARQRTEAAALGFAGRREMAESLLDRAAEVARRIGEGIEQLKDEKAFDAFRIANRAMAMQARQRAAHTRKISVESVSPPEWRPFQLAFLMLNLKGIVDPRSEDRQRVELLFFPTGGGKTEAYLGLAAFTLAYRRLRIGTSGTVPKYAGMTVLMRYTLRLLTLDQMGRAAALICALELIRKENTTKLGKWPFEIGLWVGSAATPNYMGTRHDDKSMVHRVTAYKNGTDNRRPIPMEKCPWCGTLFEKNSFSLDPSTDEAENLHVRCMNERCEFSGDEHLPILMVDEPIYRRLPCFLIATVDKFAGMPWRGEIASLFGKVQGFERGRGFRGWDPDDRGSCIPMAEALPPPELIIQDELHLISGPLGTIAGLYETAIESLCTKDEVVPKIVSSTATVRRAKSQIGALFGRSDVTIFPPPGPDRTDSYFAKTLKGRDSSRLYVGVAAQGRSVKRVVLRTYLALMSAAYKIYMDCGGSANPENPADPYMTMLGYFNSLRELGGTRRLVEDELTSGLEKYGDRKRVNDSSSPFVSRKIRFEVQELTSRVTTDKVSAAKDALARPFRDDKNSVDVSLATNMISVGLDISRLGMMAVFAQPKSISEYIQATSRVGRERSKPGLVLTIFNINRARDRSHYERFGFFHDTFYTGVEATSVTPFSPRALDRALFPVVVALARLGFDYMNLEADARKIREHRDKLEAIVDVIESRVRKVVSLNPESMSEADIERVKESATTLLDSWKSFADELAEARSTLSYTQANGALRRKLIHEVLDPKLRDLTRTEYRKFVAGRSMRDVEPVVALLPKYFDSTSQLVKVSDARSTVSYVRQSQLVTTYGPGAMIDLPWFATVVSGLDFWKKGDPIVEPRLMRKIRQSGMQVNSFHTPKDFVDDGEQRVPEGVTVWRFPGWSLTQETTRSPDSNLGRSFQTRQLVRPNWIDRTSGKAEISDWNRKGQDKKFDIVPIRFIRACPAGHMDDIDWYAFVHERREIRESEDNCSGRLWLDEMGTSGELNELRVRCDQCNRTRWLSEAAGKNNPALGRCTGRQDWLGQEYRQQSCEKPMRLLIRTASNAYFPLKVSVISLPDRDEIFRKAIDECWVVLSGLPDTEVLKTMLNFIPELKSKLSGFAVEEIWSEIESRKSGQSNEQNARDSDALRIAELKLLMSEGKQLGEEGLDSPFFAEEVDVPSSPDSPFMQMVHRVLMVHRLREVTALVGYSRFEYLSQDGDDEIPFSAEQAPLGKNSDWLPAVENRGEGIFIQLNNQRVDEWACRPEVQAAAGKFVDGVSMYNEEQGTKREFRGPEFVLLHTLSHLLMHAISLECGYPSASIKERIYVDRSVGYGILLYTASSDSHGTLGGLASAARSIRSFLQRALEIGATCSNDPICSLHVPNDPNDKRHFHGAACHSCAFTSETSCECFNDFLDRNLVLRTLSRSMTAFF